MRIGVNARFLIKGKLEGIGWYSYHILRNMVTNHPEHEYFFFFDREPHLSFQFNQSVQSVVLFPQARHPILWYWWFEISIPYALKQYRIDCFLSPDGYASLSTHIPQFLVIHDLAFVHYPQHVPFLVRKYYQWFVPRHIGKAKHLFAVSEFTKRDIMKQYHVPENKISLAFNGIRKEFQPINELEKQKVKNEFASGKNYFLFVGAIHPRKNVANLIRAFDVFKKDTSSDMVLLIIGRKAWLADETENALNDSINKADIFLYNHFDTHDLSRITAAAWYVINPSLFEGFGVPVLEALYCDVPVMVSDRASLPEVAGPGAIRFNPVEVADIASAMKQGINDPDRHARIELGKLHRRKFEWNVSAECIYSEIMRSRKPAILPTH